MFKIKERGPEVVANIWYDGERLYEIRVTDNDLALERGKVITSRHVVSGPVHGVYDRLRRSLRPRAFRFRDCKHRRTMSNSKDQYGILRLLMAIEGRVAALTIRDQ